MNQARFQLLLARVHYDLAATQSAALVVIGTRLGLYAALASSGPITAQELGVQMRIHPAYIRPWLVNQAAAGFVTYDARGQTFALDDEQRELFASDNERSLLAGFAFAAELQQHAGEVETAMRQGRGVPAKDYSDRFRMAMAALDPGKAARIVGWLGENLPAILEEGGHVLDIGCGEGFVLRQLAETFPRSHFTGIDSDERAIARARELGGGKIDFHCTVDVPSAKYDLVLTLDTLHEASAPYAMAVAVRRTLSKNSVWIIVEAAAGDTVASNLNPSGRLLSAVEMLYCIPTALDRGAPGIGAMAGEHALTDLLRKAGLVVRRIEDPLRLVLEARR